MPLAVSAILVSIATVVPYYLGSFTFYCVCSAVHQEHYGFTQGLYG
jgi:hypothetical protein